jgi:hypothetical protein
MQNLRLLYKNLWRDATLVAVSSENGQYPAEDSQDDDPSAVFRSAACGSAVTIDMDLGAAYEYDFVALLNHNLQNGGTYQVKGADNSGISTNVVTDTLPFNGNNLRVFLGAARTKRYVRITLTDTTNPSGYVQIGTVIVGKYYDLGVVIGSEGYEDGYGESSEMAEAASGNEYLVQERARRGETAFTVRLTDATKAYAMAAQLECGVVKAVDFIFDYTTPNSSSWWARMTAINRAAYQFVDNWTLGFEIKAVS